MSSYYDYDDYHSIVDDSDELYDYDDEYDQDDAELVEQQEWENYYHNIANELDED